MTAEIQELPAIHMTVQTADLNIIGFSCEETITLSCGLMNIGRGICSVIIKPSISLVPKHSGSLDIEISRPYMRANIDLTNIRQLGNEEVADLLIKSSDLLPTKIMEDIVPNLIDELPLFFLIASLIEGESEFFGLSELKHKESDRLSIMINNLKELDVEVHFNEDSLKIVGKNDRIFPDGVFDSHGDHRIAMTMLVAGLRSPKGVIVNNIDCINTSFPEFVDQAKTLGFNLNYG